jgi:hypothetical protein
MAIGALRNSCSVWWAFVMMMAGDFCDCRINYYYERKIVIGVIGCLSGIILEIK